MHWIVGLKGGPCRVNHAAVAVGEMIYSFGGYHHSGNFREFTNIDVHTFNTVALKWSSFKIKKSKDAPFQRYGHTVVAYEGKIYLWGGRNDIEACNTLYCFDTKTHTWSAPKVSGSVPEARDGHSACVIDDHMYIFAGYVEKTDCYTQEVYALNLKNFVWNHIHTRGEKPLYRDFHIACTVKGIMYVWGGREMKSESYTSPSNEEYSSKMYCFNPSTNFWNCIVSYGNVPIGRRSHSAVVYENCFYIFGGYNSKEERHYNDLHRFNTETHTWETIKPLGNPPHPRRRQASCLINERIYIFGGTSPPDDQSAPIQPHHEDEDFFHTLDRNLIDLGDLHVLELDLRLKSLCLTKVIKYKLDTSFLPFDLCLLLKAMATPNTISQTG